TATPAKEEAANSPFGAFSFDEKQGDSQTGKAEDQKAADSEPTPPAPPATDKKPKKKKKKLFGMTTGQLVTVAIFVAVALVAIIAVAVYFVMNNG
ncbi:MAG: hypothetical protein WA821_01225, partial [Anaerolineales bacterium]